MKYISTHTLTWSVTINVDSDFMPFMISTHTLTWSVTNDLAGRPERRLHFNSHAHVERDTTTTAEPETTTDFNSHAHVERDKNLCKNISAHVISTHTLTWSVTR